jgi:hypothetical protein
LFLLTCLLRWDASISNWHVTIVGIMGRPSSLWFNSEELVYRDMGPGQCPVGRGVLDVLGPVPNSLLCDAEMSEILTLQFSLLVNIHIK